MTDNTLKTVHMKHLAQYLAQSKYQYISVFFKVTLCFSLLFSRSTISKSLVCPVAQSGYQKSALIPLSPLPLAYHLAPQILSIKSIHISPSPLLPGWWSRPLLLKCHCKALQKLLPASSLFLFVKLIKSFRIKFNFLNMTLKRSQCLFSAQLSSPVSQLSLDASGTLNRVQFLEYAVLPPPLNTITDCFV